MHGQIKLFAGTGCMDLAKEISEYVGTPLSGREIKVFPNENIFVQLHESIRGQDVFLIQTTSSPVNYNIMELLVFLDAIKRASPDRVTVVIPYLAYCRSDKKDKPRVPITARLLADMIGVAGVDRYVFLDLHAQQIQGFYSMPGDVLTVFPLISDHFRKKNLKNAVVVAADLGFAKKARNLAAELNLPLALVEKRRIDMDTEALTLVGEVKDHDVIIVDDEVDTGGTMVNAVHKVREHGARDIYLSFAHPIFSGNAVERLKDLPVKETVTTNSIPIPRGVKDGWDNLKIKTVAGLLGDVIKCVHGGQSVGDLFKAYQSYK
jgi:ribose-phosphate pyrophosphokinase